MTRKHSEIMVQNPLRLLKPGFATYTPEDKRQLAGYGLQDKQDVERTRRLDPEEEPRILAVLENRLDELTFFVLALESAMRMFECYTLHQPQIAIAQKTVHLERTKNGDTRQVPLTTPALAKLNAYMKARASDIKARDGRLFSFWNGDPSELALDDTTPDLSKLFNQIFKEANVSVFHFHDLRDEATCRLYEKTTLSDVLIAKITGHRDLRSLKRYASIRGERPGRAALVESSVVGSAGEGAILVGGSCVVAA